MLVLNLSISFFCCFILPLHCISEANTETRNYIYLLSHIAASETNMSRVYSWYLGTFNIRQFKTFTSESCWWLSQSNILTRYLYFCSSMIFEPFFFQHWLFCNIYRRWSSFKRSNTLFGDVTPMFTSTCVDLCDSRYEADFTASLSECVHSSNSLPIEADTHLPSPSKIQIHFICS